MRFEWQWDRDTFGFGIFYIAPLQGENVHHLFETHTIQVVFLRFVWAVTWPRKEDR